LALLAPIVAFHAHQLRALISASVIGTDTEFFSAMRNLTGRSASFGSLWKGHCCRIQITLELIHSKVMDGPGIIKADASDAAASC
jgi:hypothetical protein